MCCKITREQMESEQEQVRRNIARRVNELTDNGKALVPVFVDLMEGNYPEIPLHIRIESARDLIQFSKSVPVAAEHIRKAETIIAEFADDE